MSLCLGIAFTLVQAVLPTEHVTLAWEHSVEKIRWEEDYSVRTGRLELMEARVKGSGAGMEVPEAAVLREGWWHYRPAHPAMEKVVLTRSTYTKDYELCWEGRCRKLTEILGLLAREGETMELFACRT
jgi:hypothetical protein